MLAAQARPTTNRPAEELYKANCVMCHMPDGNAAIPNMNFADGKWLHGSTPAQLAKVITNGVPATAMMAFKERFSDAEILGLAKYVMAFDKTHKAPARRSRLPSRAPTSRTRTHPRGSPRSLMAQLNVALIGYAFMGRAHSNAYRQVGRFFTPKYLPRMKVLCGRTPAAVKTAADQLGWEEASTDWREVVRRKDIDIVDIVTPGDSHAEIAIEAAKAGKVVFCEKPLANTVKESERMLAAVKKAGVIHMVCHNYRKAPAVTLARQIIDEGRLGRLYHFRGTYLQDWVADPNVPLYWRLQKEKAGSGALGDIASHSLDLARFLVGEVTEVTGALETFVKERPLPENPKKKARSRSTTHRPPSCASRMERSARSKRAGSRRAARTTTGSRSTAARAQSRSTLNA
jgi:predicted dehydrogenase/cytochrome c553